LPLAADGGGFIGLAWLERSGESRQNPLRGSGERTASQSVRQSDSANCRQAKMIADKYWQGNPRLLYTSHTHGDARGKVRRTKGKMRNFNANRKQKKENQEKMFMKKVHKVFACS